MPETQELQIQQQQKEIKESVNPLNISPEKEAAFKSFLEEIKSEQEKVNTKTRSKTSDQKELSDQGVQDQKTDKELSAVQLKEKAYLQATVDTFKKDAPDTLKVIKENIIALKTDEKPSDKIAVFQKANDAFAADINAFKNVDLHKETIPNELTTAADLVKEIQTAISGKTAELADHELLETTYKGVKDINTKDYFAKYTDVADLRKIQKATGYDLPFNKGSTNFKDIETNIIKGKDENTGYITYQTINEAIQTRIDEINATTIQTNEVITQKNINLNEITDRSEAVQVMENNEKEFNATFDNLFLER